MEICCDSARLLRPQGYRERYGAYDPPEELVEALRSADRPVTVLLVFGSWCPDSGRLVPRLIKSLDAAASANVQLLGVHVSYAETDPGPFMAGPIAVSRYPTIALLDGRFSHTDQIPEGVELARFVEADIDASTLRKVFGGES